MNFKCNLFLLAACSIEVSFCQTEVNSTLNTRREILEQQARNAYQNACLRLQELANWMSVVFKITGVWANSAVNEHSAKSGRMLNETDRRNVPILPPRPKITGSECSVKNVQVTVQTYAYLQSQMFLLKAILGRNIVRTGKLKFVDANASLRERMRVIEAFNTTLSNILYKLKQSTKDLPAQVNSESWKSWNLIQDIQDSRFLQYLQDPRSLFQNIEGDKVLNDPEMGPRTGSRTFFQNLGKALDGIIFPTVPQKSNSINGEADD